MCSLFKDTWHRHLVEMCVCLLQEDQTAIAAFYGLAVSILGTFGFAFLISSFVVFPVQERECKVLVIRSSTVRVCYETVTSEFSGVGERWSLKFLKVRNQATRPACLQSILST